MSKYIDISDNYNGKVKVKGFIEVKTEKNCEKMLINVKHIETVYKNIIYLAFNCPDCSEQDSLRCKETYEEIKAKLEEAMK